MADFSDGYGKGSSGSNDDLKAYLEERKKQARRYVRTAKKAQETIDELRRREAVRRKALGLDN